MLNFLSVSGNSKMITLECEDTLNVELTQLISTQYLTPRNLLFPSFISVSGPGSPQIMINDSGVWVGAGTVHAGQRIKVRAYSSSLYSTTVVTTITINSTTFAWKLKTRKALITPLPFTFQHQINLEPSTITYSNYITLSGFEVAVPISISGDNDPKFSINNGTYVSSGIILSGQTIRIKANSSNLFSNISKCTLTVSNVSSNFVVMTRRKIDNPIAFEFENLNNVGVSSSFISNAIIPTGYDINTPIQISGGEYCINNDGLWKSEPGELVPGQSIKLRVISSPNMGVLKVVSLVLGNFTTQWAVTTGILTGNPDAFSFDDIVGLSTNTSSMSDTVIITGLPINTNTNISVTNTNSLKYLIDTTPDFTMLSGIINTGSSLTLKMNSSQYFNSYVVGYVTIGGISSRFRIKTRVANIIPNAIQFFPIVNVEPDVFIYSNIVSILNIDEHIPISIFGSGSQFSIDGGVNWQTNGVVSANTTLQVRLVSSPFSLTMVSATIIIGESIFDFIVTTREQKITPANFEFIAVENVPIQSTVESNTIIISDIDAAAPITITNGHYRINNFPPTSNNGLIGNGDRLQIIINAASTTNTASTATVNVGSLTRFFTVTTTVDAICDTFELIPDDNTILNFSEVNANIIRVVGFDTKLNVYVQSVTQDMNIQIAVNDEPNQVSNWLTPSNSTVPVAHIYSGQYLAVRGHSGDYSTSPYDMVSRIAIIRIAPTASTGVTSIFNITTSKLANAATIQGNTITILPQDSRPDVYYYSDLLLIDCVGDLNSPLVALTKAYFAIEISHNYNADYVQISMDGGLTWENAISNFGSYVDDAQAILIRAKIPSDYMNYINHMSNGFAISIDAKLWNVPFNKITLVQPISQLTVLNITPF